MYYTFNTAAITKCISYAHSYINLRVFLLLYKISKSIDISTCELEMHCSLIFVAYPGFLIPSDDDKSDLGMNSLRWIEKNSFFFVEANEFYTISTSVGSYT